MSKISDLKNDEEVIKTSNNMKKLLKVEYGLSTNAQVAKIGGKILSAFNDDLPKIDITLKKITEINKTLNGIDTSFYYTIHEKLVNIKSADSEIENLKKEYMYNLLRDSLNVIDDNTVICPICDNGKVNLLESVKNKISRLNNVKTEVFRTIQDKYSSINENNFIDLINLSREFDDDPDLYHEFLLIKGDKDFTRKYKKDIKKMNELHKEILNLEKESKTRYMNIKNYEVNLKQDFVKYFEVENENNIIFDDEKHTVEIILPRDAKHYSTGEKNLMYFLYSIYSFIGSEKNIIILDDPVSSLDIVNHYKIVFEMVRISENKKMVILTHSVELINALKSQHNNGFEYMYIESANADLHLQEINHNRNGSNITNIITLEQLLSISIDKDKNIIETLIEKENSNSTEDVHKVFHYTEPEYIHFNEVSNYDLVNKIVNFKGIELNQCFYQNSVNKIIILASLRVWIERELYSLIRNSKEKKTFLEKDTLSSKINYLIPKGRPSKIKCPSTFNRESLMSKKVMLNQSVHYQSQIMPFAYAINLSIDEINSQVFEIKQMFGY